ncbi:MAG: hypothetical protein ACK4SF_13845 [Algoriphagus aquaeductus]|uniref:hypothetical protein n=1 Tax=Algoriphagus aquaeductus TaxID=475299 RepID=UPI00391DA97A
MKNLKIILTIIILIGLSTYTFYSIYSTKDPPQIKNIENQFTRRIESKIDSLKNMAENNLTDNLYREIDFLITENYKEKKLGTTETENDQWKDILSRNLYTTYSDKFIKMAFYVFNRIEWKSEDLNYIRVEYQLIQRSPYLERGSETDQKLDEIGDILKQYDTIIKFIYNCSNFSHAETSLTGKFPVQEVIAMLNQRERYKLTNLGNTYVNNCARLHDQLNVIPEVLFQANVRYLDNKIDMWSGMYSNFNSQKVYADNLYSQLANEIEELDNDIYNSTKFDDEYLRLKRKWQSDAQKAYEYFNRK